jgi:nickel-dependent lactate racemase
VSAIELRTGAWFGDEPLRLALPSGWEATTHRGPATPPLGEAGIADAIARPIGTAPLERLAAGRRRAAIVVDDLTRPTPVADLLPHLLRALRAAGLGRGDVVVVIAGGTHAPATPAEIARKLGPALARELAVVPHDCRGDLVDLGRTTQGTPLLVNRVVAECDLRIGVGCIYPHPAAGFSGGAKILMPGVMGAETIRRLHDARRGARARGDVARSEFRRDVDEAAERIGLDFIANVVLDEDRRVAGLFAGDRAAAHAAGVRFAAARHAVPADPDADVVLANMYPFDGSVQFLADRGLWPLLEATKRQSRVAVAACPLGVGEHQLFPVTAPVGARLARRLRHFSPAELARVPTRLANLRRQVQRKRMELLVLSPGLEGADLARAFPRARLYAEWSVLLRELVRRHPGRDVRVAVYPCAPLQLRRAAVPPAGR